MEADTCFEEREDYLKSRNCNWCCLANFMFSVLKKALFADLLLIVPIIILTSIRRLTAGVTVGQRTT